MDHHSNGGNGGAPVPPGSVARTAVAVYESLEFTPHPSTLFGFKSVAVLVCARITIHPSAKEVLKKNYKISTPVVPRFPVVADDRGTRRDHGTATAVPTRRRLIIGVTIRVSFHGPSPFGRPVEKRSPIRPCLSRRLLLVSTLADLLPNR